MLGIWLGVALVNISGYQPIAEQTWVQLNPDYYPLHRSPPALFVAWRGNQFPPLEQKKKNGRWQLLFPARLVPPFELFEGEAQLSKAYLARLKRIDEMAYGMAPHPIAPGVIGSALSEPGLASFGLAPFIAEFSLPGEPQGTGPLIDAHQRTQEAEPLLAHLGLRALPDGRRQAAPVPSVEPPRTAEAPLAETTTLTLSAPAAGAVKRLCHQVAQGETLWRIANQLARQQGSEGHGPVDSHSYLLALVAENRPSMGKGMRVRMGESLYCPSAETLAQFDAMSPAQRQQQLARLEQGR